MLWRIMRRFGLDWLRLKYINCYFLCIFFFSNWWKKRFVHVRLRLGWHTIKDFLMTTLSDWNVKYSLHLKFLFDLENFPSSNWFLDIVKFEQDLKKISDYVIQFTAIYIPKFLEMIETCTFNLWLLGLSCT